MNQAKEFTVSYGYKTFNGMIGVGTLEFEADNIESMQERAFNIILNHLKEQAEEDETFRFNDFTNLNINVTEKQ